MEISGDKILHIIENANRFSTAAVVLSKRKVEIADTFIKHWIVVFKVPGVTFSDNRDKFNNNLFLNSDEYFNINLKIIAAEFPWSNSIAERHGGILAETTEKLMLESSNKYSIDVVIA